MKINLLFMSILLTVTGVFAQEQLDIRKKIIPLYSNRSDVERIALFVDKFGTSVRYETETEFLSVNYSEKPCVNTGWNIPEGRVLSYDSYPKIDLTLENVQKTYKNLFRLADDTGTSYFINSSDGITFVVHPGEQKVDSITFSPLPADANLRCKGSPDYELISDYYQYHSHFSLENISTWDNGLISAPLYQVLRQKSSDYNCYVFIYCKKEQFSECSELKKKIVRFAKKIMKTKINQLSVILGGYRNSNEIETFLIPKNHPRPTARPTVF